ncbi:transposase [Lysobacter sp. CA196]|uniref:transposase n=1 Tax=Lysobacter sp. CA196 TaxID=3455606 RepID=UPI003F8D06D4
MRKSRFTQSQIMAILKETDSGIAIKDLARKYGVSVPTYYYWRSKFSGMEAAPTTIRELQAEHRELRRLYGEQASEIRALKAAIAKLPVAFAHS